MIRRTICRIADFLTDQARFEHVATKYDEQDESGLQQNAEAEYYRKLLIEPKADPRAAEKHLSGVREVGTQPRPLRILAAIGLIAVIGCIIALIAGAIWAQSIIGGMGPL